MWLLGPKETNIKVSLNTIACSLGILFEHWCQHFFGQRLVGGKLLPLGCHVKPESAMCPWCQSAFHCHQWARAVQGENKKSAQNIPRSVHLSPDPVMCRRATRFRSGRRERFCFLESFTCLYQPTVDRHWRGLNLLPDHLNGLHHAKRLHS